MPKFRVKQGVLCEVEVRYYVEAKNMNEATAKVAEIQTPTCVDNRDYEILSDVAIVATLISEEEE